MFSVVFICEFLAGVKSRRVIWRVEELLNWKSTAGVKVWKKEKTREICVFVSVWRGTERGEETKRAREPETRREADRGGTNKERERERESV